MTARGRDIRWGLWGYGWWVEAGSKKKVQKEGNIYSFALFFPTSHFLLLYYEFQMISKKL